MDCLMHEITERHSAELPIGGLLQEIQANTRQ
jgi:hypothetical protein